MAKIEKKAFFVLILLSLAQFILVLDTTMMNVSISTLVKDLNTTVTAVQAAIAFYTLIMGSFIIAGAKIGDIIGRKKAFIIGLIIYGTGSFITSISPNIYVLILGWSIIEGLGAALVLPSMLSMVASNFEKGPERAKAYGILAAMAAIGAALGPLIGGFLTTYISWRVGFFGEVLVVIYILLNRNKIQDATIKLASKKFDYLGLILSVSGLAMIVGGILSANTYGLITARKPFVVAGYTIIPEGGIAPLYLLIGIGVALLALFIIWENSRIKKSKTTLLNPAILKIKSIVAGITTMVPYMLVMGGVLFSVSIISQVILEYSAFDSGLVLLPLSLSVLVLALLSGKFTKWISPKKIVQIGIILMVGGTLMLGVINYRHPNSTDFIPALIVIGCGVGMVASQLQNMIISSVDEEKASEASGLSSTFNNIGMSLGTALSGALIISFFIYFSTNMVNASTDFTQSQKQQINSAIETKAQTLSNSQLSALLVGVPPETANEILTINNDAENKAVSIDIAILALFGSLGLISSAFLPKGKSKT